jgi:hypothetical protein
LSSLLADRTIEIHERSPVRGSKVFAMLTMSLVLGTGCIKQSPTATPSATEPAAPTASGAGPSAQLPSATATPHVSTKCRTADLSIALEPAGGAAGTMYEWIVFKDLSGPKCTLYGYPGASLVSASGAQLGQPAQRTPVITPRVVALQPGGAAYSRLGFPNPGNFPPGKCTAPAANLRVYPPDDLQSLLVATNHAYCPGFSVTAIEATRD